MEALDSHAFFLYDEFRVGVWALDGRSYDVCQMVHGGESHSTPVVGQACLLSCLLDVDRVISGLRAGKARPVEPQRLRAPIPRPRNVFGAPVNYDEHRGELGSRSAAPGTVLDLGLFVKAPGSICGPDDAIELPDLPGREFHYEGEIAVVIGRAADTVSPRAALDHVAGFTGALDVTMRLEKDHREERSMRKSYKSFTPIGPGVLPTPSSEHVEGLALRLSVNGEPRQEGHLGQLIMPVAELVTLASSILPLEPGDLILTGTPRGVGPLQEGDRVEFCMQGLPPLALPVVRRREKTRGTGGSNA